MDILSLFSRRNLLLGLGGVAATGAVATGNTNSVARFAQLLRPTSGGRKDVALNSATYDDWSTHVGSEFRAHTGHMLRLVDVQSFPKNGPRPSNVRQQSFVARFDISKGGALPEELYRVAHPKGGTFDIFLTNGSPDKPMRMLAVFS